MKKIKFVIDTGYVSCQHEIEVEFEDDVTEEELEQCARDLVWEYVSVSYDEVQGCGQPVKARDFDSRIDGSIPSTPAKVDVSRSSPRL